MKTRTIRLFCVTMLSLILTTTPSQSALAQIVPSFLGAAESFAVLGSAAVTSNGTTVVTGNLGVSPGSAINGFPPGIVNGTIHSADAVANAAHIDAVFAYNDLSNQTCDTTYNSPTDLGGLTLTPGVYCFSTVAKLTGTLTLDAQGDPNATFIFNVGSALVTSKDSSVSLINGAQDCNIYWKVGSAATLGKDSHFVGSILAFAAVTLHKDMHLSGRAIALKGAVTLNSNEVTLSSCSSSSDAPTVSKSFSPSTINGGDISTLTITLSNSADSDADLTAPFTDTLPNGITIVTDESTTCGGVVTTSSSSITLTGGSIPANGSCTISVLVTGHIHGTFVNKIHVGALQTTHGSNTAQAQATLTVICKGKSPCSN